MVFLSLLNIQGLFKRIQLFLPRWNGRKEAKRTNVLEEGSEGEVIFIVQEDGKSWVWENMLLRQEGASSYRLYIRGEMEGWEEEDTINCYIPNVSAKSYFFDLILQGKPYYFSSIEEK